MTSFGAIVAICLVGGTLLGLSCRFVVLIPGIAVVWLWIGLEASPNVSWSNLATLVAASAAAMQFGYLAGAAITEFIPLRIRRSILPGRAATTSKLV
jgi:hypothetical protein